MDVDALLTSFVEVLEWLSLREFGSAEFYAVWGAFVLVVILTCRVWHSLLTGGKRGLIFVLLGNLLVTAAIVAGAALAQWAPGEDPLVLNILSGVAAAVLGIMALIVLSKPLFDTKFWPALFAVSFTLACGWGGIMIANFTINTVTSASEAIEEELPE